MDTALPWYVARASGLVAWAVVSASVLWGLALSTRALGKRPRPAWLLDLHRYLGGLAVVFTAVHIVAIVGDSYVHFGIVDVLVPFASAWNPPAVALGVVALYLLIAVEVTSLLRRRIPQRLWRRVHFVSFPLFALTTLHLFTAGTDNGNVLLLAAVLGTTVTVGALIAVRASASSQVAGRGGAGVRPLRAQDVVRSRSGRCRPTDEHPTSLSSGPSVRLPQPRH
jgi:DMSO/TMAO reductase YedYZ heme-binding membrane subunit